MDRTDERSGSEGTVAFEPGAKGLTGLVVKGLLLTAITFTIYRFWYVTELRRFLWSRTLIAGSPAEYLGRGKELFLGFLVALAILVPLYVVLFILSIAVPVLAPAVPVLTAVFLFVLGQYAIFRGRRYRASRTRWRGIRLGQDGSAAAYMVRASLWWLATILTLGLAFPFMRAALERYRIDHTLIGESRLRSTATGRSVLWPWLAFYAVSLLPIVVAGLAFLGSVGFPPPADLFVAHPNGQTTALTLNPRYAGTAVGAALGWLITALSLAVPLVLLLIPFYRARETRAFLSATHLGEARLVSRLKAREFYWPYFVYLLSLLVFVFVIGILFAIVAGVAGANANSGAQAAALVGGGLLYVGTLLGLAVIYVRIVTHGLWVAVANATMIENGAALEAVLASARTPGSGLNEGLADALDVGGALEIGL
ncbi:YjgN family protein [Methylorubrum sp. SB2]|uniref:YjgN family protein n=1 Tax=Methylorubrum subtropicum TaxID=3138812 RepID=UPI00313BA7EE